METDSVLDIVISGSGPYGFRLSGGEGHPLVVNKLRQQSKAFSASLKESDVLLGINGYKCQSMGHAEAMSLLENTEDSLQLIIFRSGDLSALNVAYDKVTSRLRPLSPSALPPPHLLPPPPPAGAGSLVIDQPTYLRRLWAPPPKPVDTVDEGRIEATRANHVEQAPQPPPPQSNHFRSGQDSESRPGFFVSTISAEARPWAPPSAADNHENGFAHAPVPPASGRQPAADQTEPSGNFHVSRTPAKPWVWQPSEKHDFVRMRIDVVDPQPTIPPDAVFVPPSHSGHGDGHGGGRGGRRGDYVDAGQNGSGEVEVIPRWALPLRSEYDWRSAYYWMSPEDFDWEVSEDGQYLIKKKKVFTDSSFYDDATHRYPTIEEQIKMARKVAQSLTAAGNVTARGQRMFMRRKEKADRWTIDSFMPPSKRGAATPTGIRLFQQQQQHEDAESDSEMLYYNPEPWTQPPRAAENQRSPAPWAVTKKVEAPKPTNVVPAAPPLTWKPSAMTTSFTAAAASSPPPRNLSPVRPVSAGAMPRGEITIPMPKHTGNVPPSVAFGLANDMKAMKGKGGRMFAKLRARAAATERDEDGDDDQQRQDVMRRIAGSFAAPAQEEQTDGGAVSTWKAQHQTVEATYNDQPPSASRLLELIEKSRGTPTIVERQWTAVVETQPLTQRGNFSPVKTVEFSSSKSKGGFRPVRYRAPIGMATDEPMEAVAISDF